MQRSYAKVTKLVPVKSVMEKLSLRAEIEYPIIVKAMKDDAFRKRLIENPKLTLEEEFSVLMGKQVKFPENFKIMVFEETDDMACLVLPRVVNPAELPDVSDLDPDAGVAHYCTTITCKPGYSC